MLGHHGGQLCHALQVDPLNRSIPVILMSAGAEALTKGNCNHVTFLRKPFELEVRLTTIDQMLSSYSA